VAASSTAIPLARLPEASLHPPLSSSDAHPVPALQASSDLADTWHRSGLSCKADDLATSLLCYQTCSKDDADDKTSLFKVPVDKQTISRPLGSAVDVIRSKRRFNAYAKLYSSFWDGNLVRDGNQGCEPLVFFPPLLPRVLQYSIKTSVEANSQLSTTTAPRIQESTATAALSTDALSQIKRKERDAAEATGAPNSKRPRFQQEPTLTDMTESQQIMVPSPSAGLIPPAPASDAVVQIPKKVGSTQDSDKVVGQADPRDTRVITEDEASIAGTAQTSPGADEDFGLFGAGAIAPAAEAAFFAAHGSIRVGASSASANRYDFLSYPMPCDAEEAGSSLVQDFDESLNSVILFVKKRSRVVSALPDGQGTVYRPPHSVPIGDHPWAGAHRLPIPAAIPGVGTSFREMNGDDPGKKIKKKVPSQGILPVEPSVFTRLPAPDMPQNRLPAQMAPTNVMHFASGKDGYRNRMLASFASRQFGTGLSMFESTSYRVASIQVQKRVAKRMERLFWKPGLPLQHEQEACSSGLVGRGVSAEFGVGFPSLVKRLKKDSATGDASKMFASSQRSALRRSLVSPCRVDFGPFDSGYLSAPSGMTGISTPRSRLGVSLPMGVKVPQALREQPQPVCGPQDDQLLQDFAVSFRMNWMLVARALSGVEGVIISDKVGAEEGRNIRSIPRSARQCRDRWQVLARNQPSLENEVRKSEKALRDNALVRLDKIPGSDEKATRTAAAGNHVKDDNAVSFLSTPYLFEGDPKQPPTDKCSSVLSPKNMDIEQTPKPDDPVKDPADSSKTEEILPPGKRAEEKVPTAKPAKQRRSFAALSAAKMKRQFIPLTIPGVVSGSQANQPVPSHPSHMQSVQASVAAQWSSGRTEMWPLQILDCADKHRATSRVSSTGQRAKDVASTKAPSSSSSRRQPTNSGSAPHRSPTHSSSIGRDRPAAFPPVPASSARPRAAGSPQRSQAVSATSAQAYAPPKNVAPPKKDAKGTSVQSAPKSG
jgi:hypothetical protein